MAGSTTEAFELRDMQAGDGGALRRLTLVAIRQTAASHYDTEQLDAWASWAEDVDGFHATLARGWVTVACAYGQAAGYAQLVPPSHLGLLYVDPAFGGRGLGGQLIERVIAQARDLGTRQLTATASRVARSVFARHGFTIDAVETTRRAGQELERFRMSLAL